LLRPFLPTPSITSSLSGRNRSLALFSSPIGKPPNSNFAMLKSPVSSGSFILPDILAISSAVPDHGISTSGETSASSILVPLPTDIAMSFLNPIDTSDAITTLLPKLARVS
jgi:hypothetical protein